MPTDQTSTPDKLPQGINCRRLVLGITGLPIFFALFMFLPAGTWAWPKGWLFVLILLVIISAVFLVLHRVNPEVVVARSRFHEGTKGWDKILLSFYFPAMLAVILVAALDDGRFHWFPVPMVGLRCRLRFASCRNWNRHLGRRREQVL